MAAVLDRESAALAGRAIIVTGASAGIGRHVALMLAGRGARVVLVARGAKRLDEVVAEIHRAGGEAIAVAADVTRKGEIEHAVARAEEAFGPPHGLVNGAGLAGIARFLEAEPAFFDSVVDTNLKGAWLMAQAVARRMIAAGRGGAIVNVASVVALRNSVATSAYAASKAALVQLTRVLALEWARHDIRVNALALGYFEAGMSEAFAATPDADPVRRRIPMRRFGRVEELDGPLLLLLSDAASFVTGAVLPVDGGHLVASV